MTYVIDAATVDAAGRPEFAQSAATMSNLAGQTRTPLVRVEMQASGNQFQIAAVTVDDNEYTAIRNKHRLHTLADNINRLLLAEAQDDDEPVSADVAQDVIERLAVLVLHRQDEPQVHTLADGGLAVRWVEDTESLDIEFDADGDALAIITRHDNEGRPIFDNGYLQDMWVKVGRWLRRA